MKMKRFLVGLLVLAMGLGFSLGLAEEVEVIRIKAWTIGPGPMPITRASNLEKAAERLNVWFEEQGIAKKVELIAYFSVLKWGPFKTKFYSAFAAGEAPDIVMLKETPELAEGGFIIPLDDHINEYWDEVYSDFYPTMFEAVKWDKQRWGIPQDATPHGIWYRKDVLRELGYTDEQIAEMLPATAEGVTMDDLKALAQEAVEAGLVETAFRHRPSPGDTVYIYMRIFGGRAFDPATGRLVLTKSAALEAFKWFKGLVDGGLLPMAAPPWGVIHKEFVDGEILFTFASHVGTPAEWIAKYGLTLEALEENLGFMVFPPAVPDATPITTLGPLAYLVTTQSEHPDIAALVLKFASDVDLVIEHSLQTMRPLIRKSALLHPNIQPGPPPEPGTAAYESYVKKRYILETTPMLEYAVDIPKHPDWGKYKKAVFEHLIAVETGKLAPQEAVEKLVEILKMDIPDIIIED